MVEGPGSYAEWTAVPWEAGTLTAVAHDAKGASVAKDTRYTNGKPAKLELSIDAPSKASAGTLSSAESTPRKAKSSRAHRIAFSRSAEMTQNKFGDTWADLETAGTS